MAKLGDFSFVMERSDAAAVEGRGGLGEFEDERAFVVEADVAEADRVLGDDLVIDAETGNINAVGSVLAVGFEFEGVPDMRSARTQADSSRCGLVQHKTITGLLKQFPRYAAQLDIAPPVHRRLRHTPPPKAFDRTNLLPFSGHSV